MNNVISKERLEKIAFGSVRQSQEEGVFIAREVLAYREAESKPVAFTDSDELAFKYGNGGELWEKPFDFGRDIPLYASPVLGQTPESSELLSAIKVLVNRYRELASAYGAVTDDLLIATNLYHEATAEARSAIAKATGESE